MSLEDAIRGNTEAIIALTEALIKSERLQTPIIAEVLAHVPPLAEVVDYKAEYEDAKARIKELAPLHREEIKALNTKYGLRVFADILVDPNDASKGFKSVDTLIDYLFDLSQLEQK